MENRNSIVLPAEVLEAFHAKILEIAHLIQPYLVDVVYKDEKPLLKQVYTLTPFAKKCVEYAVTNPEYMPIYYDVQVFANHVATLMLLDTMDNALLSATLGDIRARLVDDTLAKVAAYYRLVKDIDRNKDRGHM